MAMVIRTRKPLLSYLSVLSTPLFFILAETHARPVGDTSNTSDTDIPSGNNTQPASSIVTQDLINLMFGMASYDAILATLLTGTISDNSTDNDTNIPYYNDQLRSENDPAINVTHCVVFSGIASAHNDVLVYASSGIAAAINGLSTVATRNFTIPSLFHDIMLSQPTILGSIQTILNQELSGAGAGVMQGLIAPTLTPAESTKALSSIQDNCFVYSDPTGQLTDFTDIPRVEFLSGPDPSIFPALNIANNTQVHVDTTKLLDNDNCSSLPSPSLEAFLSILRSPRQLPVDFNSRQNMSTDTICAGPEYMVVDSLADLIQATSSKL
ncbi:hypothetical protein Clacol_008670 [Clathrus columnatus]|uniref:Uncharacterized protein n=1 Tax=Clathrus columnatus TaxID=1419009 RepID=A0AAV5APU8_9AGAM|nr:hypothetical protein Clacol_008670 [Clathrus columnatus]